MLSGPLTNFLQVNIIFSLSPCRDTICSWSQLCHAVRRGELHLYDSRSNLHFVPKCPTFLGLFVLPEIYSNGDINFHILTDITCYRYKRTKIDRRTRMKSRIVEHVTIVDYRVCMAAKLISNL